MESSADRPQLGWGDRLCLRWAAWTFAGLAVVVAVTTVAMAGAWWHVAGREGVQGGGRLLPTVVLLLLGTIGAVALYGVSRLCRAVTQLCAEPASGRNLGDRQPVRVPMTAFRERQTARVRQA